MVEMTMSFSAALNDDKKYKKESLVERMERHLETVFSMLSETGEKEKGFGWKYYGPFFVELKTKKYLTTFSHLIYSSVNDATNEKWLQDNQDKVTEFKDWFKGYQWEKS